MFQNPADEGVQSVTKNSQKLCLPPKIYKMGHKDTKGTQTPACLFFDLLKIGPHPALNESVIYHQKK